MMTPHHNAGSHLRDDTERIHRQKYTGGAAEREARLLCARERSVTLTLQKQPKSVEECAATGASEE